MDIKTAREILSSGRTDLHEQNVLQRAGASVASMKDKVLGLLSDGPVKKMDAVIRGLQSAVETASRSGIEAERPVWNRASQGFDTIVVVDGEQPETVDELAKDPRWKGTLAAWLTRARSAGYDVSLTRVDGKLSLFLDPGKDAEAFANFYAGRGQDVRRDASDRSHRDKMGVDEIRRHLMGGKIRAWDLTTADLLKLHPGATAAAALAKVYDELFSGRNFGATLTANDLLQYVSRGIGSAKLSELWRSVPMDVLTRAAEVEGWPEEEVLKADRERLSEMIVSSLKERSSSRNPVARKALTGEELVSRLRGRKIDAGSLDKVDREKVLDVLRAERPPETEEQRESTIVDLLALGDAKRLSDRAVLDAVSRGSYSGERAAEEIVKQLGRTEGVAKLQVVIRAAGREPVSADASDLGRQLSSIAKDLARPIEAPVTKNATPRKQTVSKIPAWADELRAQVARLARGWRRQVDDERERSSKRPLDDAAFAKAIEDEVVRVATSAKKPPANGGDVMRMATAVLKNVDDALANVS
jgi:hypothetical protein